MAKKKQAERKPMKPTKAWATVDDKTGRCLDVSTLRIDLWEQYGESMRRVLVTEVER